MLKVAGFQLGRSAARLSLPVPFSAVWSLGGNGQATSLVRLQHTTRFSTLRQFNSISRGLSAEKTRPPGQTTPSKAPHAADNVQLSTKQVEFETSADSDVNSFTTPRLDPSIPHPTGRQSTQDPGVSELQPEYQRDSGPEANSIAKEPDSTFDETSPISLPDLTQGIPSTIDAELAQRRQDGRPQNRDLSLAEAEGTAGSNQAGEAGRSRPSYISDLERRRQRAANYLLTFLLVSTIGTTVFLGRNWDTPEEEAAHYDAPSGWGLLAFWRRIKARVNGVTSYYTEPTSTKLLPDREADRPDHFLALSLEDLLIHSEWSREHGWRLAKRPGVDYFLQYLSQYYEIAIWTSMPFATAVGMLVKLDPYRLAYPMFREATRYQNGEHIKDLSFLNRDLSKIIVLDTDPSHLRNQPENAIILPKWKGEPGDKDLVSYIPFLEFLAASGTNDIRPILAGYTSKDIPTEYAQREARARKLFYESKAKEKGGGRLKSGKLGALVRPQSTMQQRSELTGKILPTYDGETYIMDFVRTRGQAAYEEMAENLRVNGEKFLAESEAMEKADHEARKKELKESLSIGNWVSRLFSDEKSEGQSKEES